MSRGSEIADRGDAGSLGDNRAFANLQGAAGPPAAAGQMPDGMAVRADQIDSFRRQAGPGDHRQGARGEDFTQDEVQPAKFVDRPFRGIRRPEEPRPQIRVVLQVKMGDKLEAVRRGKTDQDRVNPVGRGAGHQPDYCLCARNRHLSSDPPLRIGRRRPPGVRDASTISPVSHQPDDRAPRTALIRYI